MKSLPPRLCLACVLGVAAAGCIDGTQTGVPEPYAASVQGVWELDYEPTTVVLSQRGLEDAEGVLGAEPLGWKGSPVTLDCADPSLLCPEEVLGDGTGLWPVEEMDPSELLFPVAVQPNACTEAERVASGGAACGAELLPVEEEMLNIRLPSDGSTLFMPRAEIEDELRVCYARTTVDLAFQGIGKPLQDGVRPQARRVEGTVTVSVPAGCLHDDDGRPLAPLAVDADLRMETAFSGTWAPPRR